MNKNIIVVLIVVLLAAIGGGALFLNVSRNSQPTNEGVMLDEITQTPTINRSSLRDLMATSANQMCTFTSEEQSAGTFYAGNDKFRTDIIAQSPDGSTMNSHMISDGSFVYIWTDGAPQGMKMALSELDKFNDQTVDNTPGVTSTQQAVDVNTQVNVDCSPWSVDETMFQLPDMEFTDLSSMMQGIRDAMPSVTGQSEDSSTTPSSNCSACNALSGEPKTQCLAALGCN